MRPNHGPLWVILCVFALMYGCADDTTSNSSGNNRANNTNNGDCSSDCNDDDACTEDACVGGQCVNTYEETLCCTADQCEIDGECYDNGEASADNPCQVCLVAVDAAAWSSDATATCDDGDPCTMDDVCVAGQCEGSPFVCDDGNPCTDDVCDGAGACEFNNNTAPCEDGDLCTDGDTCGGGTCQSGQAATCDDQNGCTTDSCDPATGCVNTPEDGVSCDDGDICSTASVCENGVCIVSEVDSCDDSDVCTIDFCDSADGCGYDDISDRCADSNPCTDEACDAAQGCIYPFNTDACDDGSLCTVMDTCSQGSCVGTPVPVDDGNLCTDDACDPATGVMNVPNTLPCDDNDACTVGDTCGSGSCQPGTTPLACDDNDVCTTDSCDSASGCVFTDISSTCDDGNACTTDSCDAVNGCQNTVILSFACRPTITVTYPPRAATITGTLGQPVVVTGTVASGAGAISTFTINGVNVAVDPATGAFSHAYTPRVGSNTLVFEAVDALTTEENRVQAFHWSTDYTLPNAAMPGVGSVDPGLGIWLGQQTIDSGQPPPPTHLAAIFEGVFANLDISSFFDSSTPITSSAGYDIYLTSLSFNDTDVALQATDTGIAIQAAILDISGDLVFDCTSFGCLLLGGDSTGGLDIDSIVVTADLVFTVQADNTIAVTIQNSNTSINNLNIFSNNGFTNFLLSIIEPFILGGIVGDLETELNTQLNSAVGPLLGDAFNALAFNLVFDLPKLDGSGTVSVALESDFSSSDFNDASPGPQGGQLDLRAWATAATRGVPAGSPFDQNLGVPMRIDCASGMTQAMVVPQSAPLEIVFADDTINQILRAAWWGGFLQFPLDPAALGSVDLSQFGVSNLNLDVSGWLPPVAADCGTGGQLLLQIGDLRIDATLDLFGQPITAIVYVSFEAPISLGPGPSGDIAFTVSSIQNVNLEVSVQDEASLGAEAALQSLLETELVPALGGLLGGGQPLASFPLPEIDLSSALGQPPGTSLISIATSGSTRSGGNTIISGALQ